MRGQLRIGVKLLLSFGLMIVLLFLVGAVGFFGMRYVRTEVRSLEKDNEICTHVNMATQNVMEAQRDMSLYLLNEDDKSYQDAKTKNAAAKAAFEDAKKSMGPEDVEIRKAAEATGPVLDATVAGAEKIYSLFDGRKKGDTARRETGTEVNKACDALKVHLDDKTKEITPGGDAEKIAAVKLLEQKRFEVVAHRQEVRLALRNIQIGNTPKQREDADKDRLDKHGKMVAAMTVLRDKALDDNGKALAQAAIDKADLWAKAAAPFKEESDKIETAQNDWIAIAFDCVTKSIAIVEMTKTQMQQTESKIYSTVRNVVLTILVVGGLAIMIGVFLTYLLNRSISHKMLAVTDMLGHVVDEGDFHVVVEPTLLTRQDEIGHLAQMTDRVLKDYRGVSDLAQALADGDWTKTVSSKGEKDLMNINLQHMVDKVNEALHRVSSVVEQVAGGAGEVASASDSLSNGSTQSAASLEEISASMGEVSSQTTRNAQNATEANQLAKAATDAAVEGKEMMTKMISSMELITKNASDVQRVIKVIDDISFQTNLLALNAAVEAARAGTHGKGFAVVAEEVRNLAARCAKAAGETSEMVANNNKQIGEGAEIAMETSGKLDVIVEQSEKTAGLIDGIAKASIEQAQGIQQITQGLQQIDSVTQQNTASAEETASVSNEMSSSARTLQTLINQFKLKKIKDAPTSTSTASAPSSPKPVVAAPAPKPVAVAPASKPVPPKPATATKPIALGSKPKPVANHQEITIDLSHPTTPIAPKPVAKPATPAKPTTAAKPAAPAPKPGAIPKPRVEQNPNQFPDEPGGNLKGGWGGVPHDQEISISLDDKSFLDDKNFGKY